MKKSFLILAMLLLCVASFALSDMVSLNYADGSRTIPVEDVERIYYSAATDSLDIQLADTNYYYKADADLQITFLDSIEGQNKREREALIAIYQALDGDNWEYNENWCSDKPIGDWFGIHTAHHNDFVTDLSIYINLSEYERNINNGKPIDINKISNELEYFIELQNIQIFSYTELEGIVPISIFNHKTLSSIEVKGKNLIVEIPQIACELPRLRSLIIICDKILMSESFGNVPTLIYLALGGKIGTIPDGIGTCENLQHLNVVNSDIKHFPRSISKLSKLESIAILNNPNVVDNPIPLLTMNTLKSIEMVNSNISGTLSSNLFLNKNLNYMDLRSNKLRGTLPVDVANTMSTMDNTGMMYLDFNNLSGDIPQEIQNHPNWCIYWQTVALNNQFNLKNLYLPGPKFEGVDIEGDSIYSEDIYPKNKYTILWSIASEMAWGNFLNWNASVMVQFYEKYKNYGVDILYAADEWNTIDEIEALKEEYNIPFRCFNTNITFEDVLIINQGKQRRFFADHLTPEEILGNSVMVVDSTGNTVFMSEIDGFESELDQFLYRNLCKDSIDYYVSSDYSQHMLIDTLQMATIGKGIDIVLMGDAYSDRQIADSTYHKDLQYLYENLFIEEPYKSYKEMFNVFTVNVVSPTEGYEHGSTALGGFFGYETEVGGNDGAVIEYASLAVEYEKLDNAIVIVAMNSDKYAGTCYMYYPSDTTITFGSGLSISYFPRGGDAETFAQLLHHEALGHGFAKLADEYAYEHYGAVSKFTVVLHQEQQTNWGWWKNIDFTNDSTEIRWSRLLLDERYQYDGLGAFEGGLTYWTGVWRPTENSIMRYNIGGFNAPSREAIYYRIHKLAYGDEWEYDYEKFVEWDAKNRKTAESPLLIPSRDKMENFTPTHPPVIKQMSWREAVEQKAKQKVKAMPEERNSTSATTQQGAKIIYTTRK